MVPAALFDTNTPSKKLVYLLPLKAVRGVPLAANTLTPVLDVLDGTHLYFYMFLYVENIKEGRY